MTNLSVSELRLFKSLKSFVCVGILCFSESCRKALWLHFVKQAAPSVTLTCIIYPERTSFATIIKVISIEMSDSRVRVRKHVFFHMKRKNSCCSLRWAFVEQEVKRVSPLMNGCSVILQSESQEMFTR